jgi:glucose-6-phosphate-specific signal transduction histidine kinase
MLENKKEIAEKLIVFREELKSNLERELRDNQMQGITFLIDKVSNEVFTKIGETFNLFEK